MLSKGSQRLADDHVAVDKLLKQIQTALNNGDVNTGYEKIDLFWAKLAVHIRAEHLHLFPQLLSGVAASAAEDPATPLTETEVVIERLRADHEFFMRELANAVEAMRTLAKVSDRAVIDKGLAIVRETVLAVEEKLATHNLLEETFVYRLAGTVLNAKEQAELANNINRELENRPPRFAANVW
jgi:hypothetical protein